MRATVERWALALRALATSVPKSRSALEILVPKAVCFVEAETAEGKRFARARRAKAKAHRSTATVPLTARHGRFVMRCCSWPKKKAASRPPFHSFDEAGISDRRRDGERARGSPTSRGAARPHRPRRGSRCRTGSGSPRGRRRRCSRRAARCWPAGSPCRRRH